MPSACSSRTVVAILSVQNYVIFGVGRLSCEGNVSCKSTAVRSERRHSAHLRFELAVRFAAFERKSNCLRDMWFIFDSALATRMDSTRNCQVLMRNSRKARNCFQSSRTGAARARIESVM